METVQSPAERQPPDPQPHRSPPSSELSGEPEPLTEQAQREAGLPIDVYGESVVRKRKRGKHVKLCKLRFSSEVLYVVVCTTYAPSLK